MDDHFELNGISFVWNRTKAAEAFFDPFLRVIDAGVEDEPRDAIVGLDEHWQLLFVVHIAFEDAAIRLISARKATRAERLRYET